MLVLSMIQKNVYLPYMSKTGLVVMQLITGISVMPADGEMYIPLTGFPAQPLPVCTSLKLALYLINSDTNFVMVKVAPFFCAVAMTCRVTVVSISLENPAPKILRRLLYSSISTAPEVGFC